MRKVIFKLEKEGALWLYPDSKNLFKNTILKDGYVIADYYGSMDFNKYIEKIDIDLAKEELYTKLNYLIVNKPLDVLKDILNKPFLTKESLGTLLKNYANKKSVALENNLDLVRLTFALEAQRVGMELEAYSLLVIQEADRLEFARTSLFALVEFARIVIESAILKVEDESTLIVAQNTIIELDNMKLDKSKDDLGIPAIENKLKEMM